MNEKIKDRKDIEECYKWDLSALFESDAEWEKELAAIDEKIAEIPAWQSKLNTAANIRAFLDERTALSLKLEDLFTYAFLRNSEDTRASDAQSMYARAYSKVVQAESAAAFFRPEVLSLGEEKLKEIIKDECLKPYEFMMNDLLRMAAHTLSDKEEQLLAAFGEALGASGRIAETLMDADMVYDSVKDKDGNDREVSDASYILLQSDSDRILRENAFRSYYKSYKQHINTYAAAYSGCVKAMTTEAAFRKFESSRAMSLANDNIPLTVYDNLIATVHKHMDTMHRYVRLRKRILGVDELHYYDVYAPLAGDVKKRYTYDEAKELVLKAVSPLGEDYCNTVRQAFRDRWIDVYPNTGKSGGAYSSGTYNSRPYIMMNFTGTLDSVSTIAHEMGHSMHSWNTNHTQPPHYADYTMFVAEVASTVNENLLIEQLLKEESDPKEKMALLNQYLEGFKGTVYRQTMFAEFEMKAHAMAERGESLDQAALCAIYKDLIAQYFGEDLVIDDEVQYEWSRIPHFYRPFYVFVYATGYCTASALSQMILNEGKPAVDRYIEFLQMGSSVYPIDELIHAGVDLNTPAPIDTALDKFAEVVAEAEKIADELGL
ncbi:MAG: oligoendopeptidase F [Erysipelotrichaceae bacterium]|nr:oligoendopeptidase F [Erysipelotrichaceae bacterium]